jgi:hypothetical protein
MTEKNDIDSVEQVVLDTTYELVVMESDAGQSTTTYNSEYDSEDSTAYQRAYLVAGDKSFSKPSDLEKTLSSNEPMYLLFDKNHQSLQEKPDNDVLSVSEAGDIAEEIITENVLHFGNHVSPDTYEKFLHRINLQHDGPIWLEYFRRSSRFPGEINVTFFFSLH